MVSASNLVSIRHRLAWISCTSNIGLDNFIGQRIGVFLGYGLNPQPQLFTVREINCQKIEPNSMHKFQDIQATTLKLLSGLTSEDSQDELACEEAPM